MTTYPGTCFLSYLQTKTNAISILSNPNLVNAIIKNKLRQKYFQKLACYIICKNNIL